MDEEIDNLISVLTYNLCWECLTGSDKGNGSGFTVGKKCKNQKDGNCMQNIVNVLKENESLDLIATQESANFIDMTNKLNQQSSYFRDNMSYVHHKIKTINNTVEMGTYYNKKKFKLEYVMLGDLNTYNYKGNYTSTGRPFQILFLTPNKLNELYIFINVHIGHGLGKKKKRYTRTIIKIFNIK